MGFPTALYEKGQSSGMSAGSLGTGTASLRVGFKGLGDATFRVYIGDTWTLKNLSFLGLLVMISL